MLPGVDDSDEVPGNDGYSGFFGDENVLLGVWFPHSCFEQPGGIKANGFVEMSKFVSRMKTKMQQQNKKVF